MQGRPTDTMSARTVPGCQRDSISAIMDFSQTGLRHIPGPCLPSDALRHLAWRRHPPEKGVDLPPAGPFGKDAEQTANAALEQCSGPLVLLMRQENRSTGDLMYKSMLQGDTAAAPSSEGGAVLSAATLPRVSKPVLTSATSGQRLKLQPDQDVPMRREESVCIIDKTACKR